MEYPNGLAAGQAREICSGKDNTFNSFYYLKMPTNYVIKSRMLSQDEIEKVIEEADAKIEKVARDIRGGKTCIEKDSKLYSLIVGAKKH